MYRVITPQRMQAMEKAFMAESGTPGLVLMGWASQAVADILSTMTDEGAVFLCGPGNNGGDGYAAARLFAEKGRKAWVWALSDPEKLTGDARTNWARCAPLGIPVFCLSNMPDTPPAGCGAVVDALFGTGLARPLEGLYADAVRWINACGLPVLAVDMPSGTPEVMVQATETAAFHLRKPAHLLFPGRINAGRVHVVDIGIPHAATDDDFLVLEPGDEEALLPPRTPDAHKGTSGHALLVAGSFGMAGAAGLAANAALRGGAGLVTVACPAEIVPTIQVLAPCATCITQAEVGRAVSGKSAIGVGPGLGHPDGMDTLMQTLLDCACPQVWDADALNWLAAHVPALGNHFVLTPHPGEAARLLACETADIVYDPIAAAQALHEKYRAVILLKGATTVIIGDGSKALNVTGSPGMATGGSGDVLTGLILALLAQGLSPFDAARLAALLHGIAGQRAAATSGVRSMVASDMLDFLHID